MESLKQNNAKTQPLWAVKIHLASPGSVIAIPNMIRTARCCGCLREWSTPSFPENLMVHEVLDGSGDNYKTHQFGEGGEPDEIAEIFNNGGTLCSDCGWGTPLQKSRMPLHGIPPFRLFRVTITRRMATVDATADGNSCRWAEVMSTTEIGMSDLGFFGRRQISGPIARYSEGHAAMKEHLGERLS